jgi:hypothetical protein
MRPKPLTDEQKASYKRLVKEKTLPLRVRLFKDGIMTVFLWIGVLAFATYGTFWVWTLVRAQTSADRWENILQDKIKEAQRDMER